MGLACSIGDEGLDGGGVVLPGPGGDEGLQGCIGCEDAVVAVAVNVGRREEVCETVQELQRRESEGGAARGIGFGQDVEDLIGSVADEVQPFEGEGRLGAVADEALEGVAVGGLDADAGVEAEAAAVIPGEHVGGLVGLEQAMAAEVAQDAGADGALEALQALGRESGGFVEAEVAGWVQGPRVVRVELVEEAVDHAETSDNEG